MTLAAVVIGVDVTGGLTPLSAAASGAEEIAGWLEQDGYEVVCLTDRPDPDSGAARPVRRQTILDAITALVDKSSVDKLVIYFAGHGYLNAASEIWLLSGAPDDPTEAIDETLSADMARGSNIRNIVFISDACRSVPVGVLALRVAGGTIFPNRLGGNVDPEIDQFFATRPGASAIETKLDDLIKATGLFTKVLRDSHLDPPRDKLIRIDAKEAVPSRWLRAVLPDRVDEAAQNKSLALTQRAQVRLESDENAFVALARFSAPELDVADLPDEFYELVTGPPIGETRFGFGGNDIPPPPRRGRRPRRRTAAREKPAHKEPVEMPALLKPFAGLLSRDAASADLLEIDSHVRQVQAARPTVEQVPEPGVPAWILVRGAEIERATVAAPHKLYGGGHAGLNGWIGVELAADAAACSVAIEFKNGRGTAVAAVRHYLCRVVVSEKGVEEINYDPCTGYLAQEYRDMHELIDRARAVASAAASRGLLEVDRQNAEAFADATRRYKMFDPALGLIAALAYAAAGLRDGVVSVLHYSRNDLGVDLYDLWLLAGAEPGGPPHFPFCPMMTQSWSFLEARGIALPDELRAAGRHGGFWTTFSKGEMAKITALLSKGELQ